MSRDSKVNSIQMQGFHEGSQQESNWFSPMGKTILELNFVKKKKLSTR